MTEEFGDLINELEAAIQKEEKELYSERTLKEAYNPKNVGVLEDPDGYARITGPCGDTIQIHLKIADAEIVDCKFITDGCGPSTASGSAVTEMAKGKTIEEALLIQAKDVLAVLDGLPEESIHCPVLAVNTLRAAIEDYKDK
ncbi:iron-sulfur cluster assembly scaffold protein [ANME-1 cluster archaeon AG-394-G21]|nr:iron-sulfur cluster assembly scaffold protein [ANME-1 cluster archaeon AG-394-G21]